VPSYYFIQKVSNPIQVDLDEVFHRVMAHTVFLIILLHQDRVPISWENRMRQAVNDQIIWICKMKKHVDPGVTINSIILSYQFIKH
jgi:hypothetical protein